ncbi:MAG: CAP domain-containing protein [Acetatifactor sp.]|nr:CAP domain-containing protein [Acetatifactor sp.]
MKRRSSAIAVALMVFALSLAGCGHAISVESTYTAQDSEIEWEYAENESVTTDNVGTALNQENEDTGETESIDIPEIVDGADDEKVEETDAGLPVFTDSPAEDVITPTPEQSPQSEDSLSETTSDLCVGDAKIIFDEVNRVREEAGLNALEWSDELAAAASIRAEEIISVMDHTRPDGSSWYTVSSLASAENIIRGPHTDGYEMMEKWMDSEGHRNNILKPDLSIIGVATLSTDKGDTGVQLFGY